MLARLKFELDDLVNEMLAQMPPAVWESDTTTFLDPVMGGGQFVKEIEKRLLAHGHSEKNVSKRVFGYESNQMRINFATRKHKLIGTYAVSNFLEMDITNKFDIIIGNPTIPSEITWRTGGVNRGRGGGDTTLYRKYIDHAFKLRASDGTVAFVTQRGGIRFAMENHPVTKINLDTSHVWSFNAGYFISIGDDRSATDVTADSVISKIYSFKTQRPFTPSKNGSFARYLKAGLYSDTDERGGTYGMVDTPTPTSDAKYMYINNDLSRSMASKVGSKLVFKGLESISSFVVTSLPVHVGSACTFGFDSDEDAERAKKFIINNKALKYLKRKLNDRNIGHVFRFCREFDLSQIETGLEYPVEWGLTPEEISTVDKFVG